MTGPEPAHPIAERIPDPAERAALRAVFSRYGFSEVWVLDNPDRAEYHFFVKSTEYRSERRLDIGAELMHEIPRRKASVLEYPSRKGVPIELFFEASAEGSA